MGTVSRTYCSVGGGAMNHKEKVEYFLKDLQELRFKKSYGSTPLHRLFWKIGLQVRPPVFCTMRYNFFFGSISWLLSMAVLSTLINSFFDSSPRLWSASSDWTVVAVYIGCTALVGGTNAYVWSRRSQVLGFPSWAQYPNA